MSEEAPVVFAIDEAPGDGVVVVTLQGELDVVSAAQLTEVLRRHLGEGQRVVVDLGAVTFIDSTGLAAIVKSPANDAERALMVMRPSRHQQPQRLLALTAVSELFAFDADA